jgi:hypothetical protein
VAREKQTRGLSLSGLLLDQVYAEGDGKTVSSLFSCG